MGDASNDLQFLATTINSIANHCKTPVVNTCLLLNLITMNQNSTSTLSQPVLYHQNSNYDWLAIDNHHETTMIPVEWTSNAHL